MLFAIDERELGSSQILSSYLMTHGGVKYDAKNLVWTRQSSNQITFLSECYVSKSPYLAPFRIFITGIIRMLIHYKKPLDAFATFLEK